MLNVHFLFNAAPRLILSAQGNGQSWRKWAHSWANGWEPDTVPEFPLLHTFLHCLLNGVIGKKPGQTFSAELFQSPVWVVGGAVLYCAVQHLLKSAVSQLEMCKAKGQILLFHRGHGPLCAEQYNSLIQRNKLPNEMNNLLQPLKTRRNSMIIRGPVLWTTLDWLVICILHKKGVDLSFGLVLWEMSMNVNMWWLRDVMEFEETLILLLHKVQHLGHETCSSAALSSCAVEVEG